MKLINIIRKAINPLKFDLKIYPNLEVRRRKNFIRYHKINKIIDVGANVGQYGIQTIYDLCLKGEIISFEPVKKTFDKLKNIVYNYKNLPQSTYSSFLLENGFYNEKTGKLLQVGGVFIKNN